MRKIEALMCDAIRNRKPFKSGNTEVKPVTYKYVESYKLDALFPNNEGVHFKAWCINSS